MQQTNIEIRFPGGMTWGDLQRITREHDGLDPASTIKVRTTFAARVSKLTITTADGER